MNQIPILGGTPPDTLTLLMSHVYVIFGVYEIFAFIVVRTALQSHRSMCKSMTYVAIHQVYAPRDQGEWCN